MHFRPSAAMLFTVPRNCSLLIKENKVYDYEARIGLRCTETGVIAIPSRRHHSLYGVCVNVNVLQARSRTFVVSVARRSASRRISSLIAASTPALSRSRVISAPERSNARFDVHTLHVIQIVKTRREFTHDASRQSNCKRRSPSRTSVEL